MTEPTSDKLTTESAAVKYGHGPDTWQFWACLNGGDAILREHERLCAERIATAEREARVRALEFAEEEARRYAKCYAHGSDGRNTFVMFAERMEREAALITATETPPPAVDVQPSAKEPDHG